MLTEIYIEALLVDEELADKVWVEWDAGEIDDLGACLLWSLVWIATPIPNVRFPKCILANPRGTGEQE